MERIMTEIEEKVQEEIFNLATEIKAWQPEDGIEKLIEMLNELEDYCDETGDYVDSYIEATTFPVSKQYEERFNALQNSGSVLWSCDAYGRVLITDDYNNWCHKHIDALDGHEYECAFRYGEHAVIDVILKLDKSEHPHIMYRHPQDGELCRSYAAAMWPTQDNQLDEDWRRLGILLERLDHKELVDVFVNDGEVQLKHEDEDESIFVEESQ